MASKVFVLTSDSEGLSLALMEAMAVGTVPVVSGVGDLGDMVEMNVNGMLVNERTPSNFASSVSKYLEDQALWAEASKAARSSANRNSIESCSKHWGGILGEKMTGVGN